MLRALREGVVPKLRARGFSGTFPHFRRRGANQIDLLTFQFDKYDGGFVVEIAKCPPEGVRTSWGAEITPGKVNAHHINQRLRLGSAGPGSDHWFRYDRGASTNQIAESVLPYLDAQAEPWWARPA